MSGPTRRYLRALLYSTLGMAMMAVALWQPTPREVYTASEMVLCSGTLVDLTMIDESRAACIYGGWRSWTPGQNWLDTLDDLSVYERAWREISDRRRKQGDTIVYVRDSYCCEDSSISDKFLRLPLGPDSTWIHPDTLHPQGWDTRR